MNPNEIPNPSLLKFANALKEITKAHPEALTNTMEQHVERDNISPDEYSSQLTPKSTLDMLPGNKIIIREVKSRNTDKKLIMHTDLLNKN